LSTWQRGKGVGRHGQFVKSFSLRYHGVEMHILRSIRDSPAAVASWLSSQWKELAWAFRPPEPSGLSEKIKRLVDNPQSSLPPPTFESPPGAGATPEARMAYAQASATKLLAKATFFEAQVNARLARAADIQNALLERSKNEARRVTVLTKAILVLTGLVFLATLLSVIVSIVILVGHT